MTSTMKNQRIAKKYSLKNRKWSYRGEGNANLVLSIIKERKILRLRKSLPNEKNGEELERIWREMDFCKGVMLPLLGERFVNVPTVVRLQQSELLELNDLLKSFRPVYRHNKGLYADHAAIFPDLCLLPDAPVTPWEPTFCVEVKPKQGWIPISDRRLSKCTFCLNQYYKLKQGTVKEKSHYCPLDLFSGNRARMKSAIKSLLICPQNNFKMFKNGNLVYGDSLDENFESILIDWFGCYDIDKLIDNFTNLVVDALISDLNESHSPLNEINIRNGEKNISNSHSRIPKNLLDEAQSLLSGPTCYRDMESLPRNCILSRILQVQKLDQVGSDEVYYLYKSLLRRDDYGYVYDLLRSPHNIFKPINSYLLATTAKDCSVLIAFKKTPIDESDYEYSVKDLNDICYTFNIGVSDLDPKPMSCIEKHRKRDYDVVVNCIEVLRSQK